MNTEIDKLISLTYEIEGLLLLLRDRGQESMAPHIRNLLADKGKALAEMLNVGVSTPKPTTETEHHEAESAPLPPIPPAVKAAPSVAATPVADEIKETIKKEATPAEVVTEVKSEVAEVAPKQPETAPKHDLKEAHIPSETELDEAQAEEDEADSEAAEEKIAQEKHRQEIKANDEAGAKMLKLFTLNDRFRFRRELFGGSDTAMKSILAIIATMPTLDDAKRYLIEDQGMDPESEEVNYFFEIIAPYYK